VYIYPFCLDDSSKTSPQATSVSIFIQMISSTQNSMQLFEQSLFSSNSLFPPKYRCEHSSQDAPPLAHERTAYAPIPPPYYHSNRVVEMDASREPDMRREGAALTYVTGSGAPQRGYMHGGRGDTYFVENRSVAHAAPPQMAHHQHPPRG
jgi:hypothetical protein